MGLWRLQWELGLKRKIAWILFEKFGLFLPSKGRWRSNAVRGSEG